MIDDRNFPNYDDEPEALCPVTQMPCTGRYCDDYGCAKEAGFFDGDGDEDDL
jgi:hypothetical protein